MVKVQVLYNKVTNSISMIMNRKGLENVNGAIPGVSSIEKIDDKNIVASIWMDSDIKTTPVEEFLKDLRLVSNAFADTYDIVSKNEVLEKNIPTRSDLLEDIKPPKKKEDPVFKDNEKMPVK